MVRKRQDLFEWAEAELYTLGGGISKRNSADAAGAGLTAEMRAARAMLRAGLECHGKQARTLSLKMLTDTIDAASLQDRGAGAEGLELRARADKMMQAVLDAESAIY